TLHASPKYLYPFPASHLVGSQFRLGRGGKARRGVYVWHSISLWQLSHISPLVPFSKGRGSRWGVSARATTKRKPLPGKHSWAHPSVKCERGTNAADNRRLTC